MSKDIKVADSMNDYFRIAWKFQAQNSQSFSFFQSEDPILRQFSNITTTLV